MVDIILTIFAWRRGWKGWALLPIVITFIIGFIVGFSGGGMEIMLIFVALEFIALITMIIVKPKKRTSATAGAINMSSSEIQPVAPVAEPSQQPVLESVRVPVEAKTTLAPVSKAKLVLPDNNEIMIDNPVKLVGRKDFEKYVSPDYLKLISRQHLVINSDGSRYYVEDRNSSNSTKVNGVSIRGLGKQEVKNGDRIELADAVTLTFMLNGAS
jgi:pSer/pThr/pTyr-binding forkhead associated (FHA) protein